MSENVETINFKRMNIKALSNSGLIQYLLIYIGMVVVVFDIPLAIKLLAILGLSITSIIYTFVNIRILKVSDDIIDQLNYEVCEESLGYCLSKYKTNDNKETLKFFFTTNDNESLEYLNTCILDKDGNEIENTKVTIMEIWRFEKTEEFLKHPKSFLVSQKESLVESIKESVDEFFVKFKEYLNTK